MKKLLGLLLFCFGINGMAQKITFAYDVAGNQISPPLPRESLRVVSTK
jgi:hypothetical protein